MSKGTDTLIAFCAGAVAGAIAGILLAPESGNDTVKKLKNAATRLADEIKDLGDKINESGSGLMDEFDEDMEIVTAKIEGAARDIVDENENEQSNEKEN